MWSVAARLRSLGAISCSRQNAIRRTADLPRAVKTSTSMAIFFKVFLKLFSKLCTCRSKQQFFFLSSRRLEVCSFLPARMIYGSGQTTKTQTTEPTQTARSTRRKYPMNFPKQASLDQLGTRHSISVDFRLARTTIVILIIYIVIFYMSSNYR